MRIIAKHVILLRLSQEPPGRRLAVHEMGFGSPGNSGPSQNSAASRLPEMAKEDPPLAVGYPRPGVNYKEWELTQAGRAAAAALSAPERAGLAQ